MRRKRGRAASPTGSCASQGNASTLPSQSAAMQGKGSCPAFRAGASKEPTQAQKAADSKRRLLREAVMMEYMTPGSYTSAHEKEFEYSVSHVRTMARELPDGLVNDHQQRTLFRTTSERLQLPYNAAYTTWELKEALFTVVHHQDDKGKQNCATRVMGRYGISRTAFYANLAKVDQTLRGDALRAHLDSIGFKHKGPEQFFLDDELALKMYEFCGAKRMAAGKSLTQFRVSCAAFLHDLAGQMPEGKERQRLEKAVCGKDWMRDVKRRLAEKGLCDVNQREVKVSKISHKRASTSQAYLTVAMFAKISAMYERHYKEGILLTRHPRPDQIWNGDEIGFDPSGQWSRVLKFRWDKQRYTLGSGEKAPFWVSVFFWSRADGQFVIPPCVIHQGSQEEDGRINVQNMMCGMERDADGNRRFLPNNWCRHQSMSGYNDRLGFRRIAYHLVWHCGSERPQYIFIDGHDSHWDPKALTYLRSNHIYPFFLRSANSEEDQL